MILELESTRSDVIKDTEYAIRKMINDQIFGSLLSTLTDNQKTSGINVIFQLQRSISASIQAIRFV